MTPLLLVITLLGTASYGVGLVQMFKNTYRPSTFSRVVWVLLAINSFGGVISSKGTAASVVLAGVLLAGNIAVCIGSFWKGTREFGKLEYVCLALLLVSAILWITIDAPLVNLGIGLFAHFVGALPTFKKVLTSPASESTGFWSLFFLASLLSIFASRGDAISKMVFPIYFTLFDGSLFVLSMRKPKD